MLWTIRGSQLSFIHWGKGSYKRPFCVARETLPHTIYARYRLSRANILIVLGGRVVAEAVERLWSCHVDYHSRLTAVLKRWKDRDLCVAEFLAAGAMPNGRDYHDNGILAVVNSRINQASKANKHEHYSRILASTTRTYSLTSERS